MKIAGDWAWHPGTQGLCAALAAAGFRALFVGGCVRNALLGVAVDDVDIATDATPENVTNIAEKAGFRAVPTGLEHGTVTVIAGGIAHEVTTFRRDVETFGRHAVVAFTTDVAEDAARRDFTMNALYATPAGEVIDPLDGLPDLMARRVRFVGDPGCPDRRGLPAHPAVLPVPRPLWRSGRRVWMPKGWPPVPRRWTALTHFRVNGWAMRCASCWPQPIPRPPWPRWQAAAFWRRCCPGPDARALAPLVHLEDGRAPDWLRRLAVLGGEDVAAALRLSRAEERHPSALFATKSATCAAGPELGLAPGVDVAEDTPPSWCARP
jgi:poly(A) polymerase